MFGQDPEQVERELSQWAGQFEEKAQRYQRMSQEAEKINITESSRDGAIRVTVGANGNITDLTLTNRIQHYSPSQLSQEILGCMQRAQTQLADRLQETIRSTVGEDEQLLQHMTATYRSRFGEQQKGPYGGYPRRQ